MYIQGLRMGAGEAGTRAPDRKVYTSAISILPLSHKSVQLCFCTPLRVSDLFSVFFN